MADSAEVKSPAGDGQRRCTYCFQELNEMTDPTQLPCSHIVCLTCLENDWKLDELQCRACSKEIKVESITNLPQLKIELATDISRNESRPSETQVKSEQCDICESQTAAVIFCIDCGKKSCKAHKESHQHYYKETHRTITISTFSERPCYYNNVCCQKHPENYLEFICSGCNDIRCSLCLLAPGMCIRGGMHQYQTLEGMRAGVEEEFQRMLKKISDKITELCNLEKKTWQTVDQMTEHCDKLRKEVDDNAEKQISEILKKSDELKKTIAGYQEDEMVKAQVYIKSLLDKVDSLESTQVSISSFLRISHITSVAREKTQLRSQLASKTLLDTSTEFAYQEFKMEKEDEEGPGMQLESLGESQAKSIKTEKIQPLVSSGIVPVRTVKLAKGQKCRTLAFNELGELVFGSGGCIVLSNIDLICRHPIDIVFQSNAVSCVAQYRMCIYVALSDGAVYEIYPYQMTHHRRELFVVNKVNHVCQICVFNEFLVVTKSHQSILIHNILTDTGESHTLSGVSVITSFCFDHDGHLLVLDSKEERVSKFMIAEGQPPKLLWRCDGVKHGLALCVDTSAKHRCIFVAGWNRTLHLIYAGKIMKVLTCDALPVHVANVPEFCSIAVYGDVLVSTAYQSAVFHVFRLEP